MLQAADDNPGRYFLFSGKVADRFLAAVGAGGEEAAPGGLGYQEVGGPSICLSLIAVVSVVVPVNEYTLLAVQEDVCGLVEQAEPYLVV